MAKQHEIKQEALQRGITELFHFTPAHNARSILTHGLASRVILQGNEIPFVATDTMRLDENLGAVSLSIHSLNDSMFAAKRRAYACEWVVFAIAASVLWTHSCRFCWKNAASSEIRNHQGYIGGPWALRKMFDDQPVSPIDDRSFRSLMQRQDCEPTDNAAEVQISDLITPDLILGAVVKNVEMQAALMGAMLEIGQVRPVVIKEEWFR